MTRRGYIDESDRGQFSALFASFDATLSIQLLALFLYRSRSIPVRSTSHRFDRRRLETQAKNTINTPQKIRVVSRPLPSSDPCSIRKLPSTSSLTPSPSPSDHTNTEPRDDAHSPRPHLKRYIKYISKQNRMNAPYCRPYAVIISEQASSAANSPQTSPQRPATVSPLLHRSPKLWSSGPPYSPAASTSRLPPLPWRKEYEYDSMGGGGGRIGDAGVGIGGSPKKSSWIEEEDDDEGLRAARRALWSDEEIVAPPLISFDPQQGKEEEEKENEGGEDDEDDAEVETFASPSEPRHATLMPLPSCLRRTPSTGSSLVNFTPSMTSSYSSVSSSSFSSRSPSVQFTSTVIMGETYSSSYERGGDEQVTKLSTRDLCELLEVRRAIGVWSGVISGGDGTSDGTEIKGLSISVAATSIE